MMNIFARVNWVVFSGVFIGSLATTYFALDYGFSKLFICVSISIFIASCYLFYSMRSANEKSVIRCFYDPNGTLTRIKLSVHGDRNSIIHTTHESDGSLMELGIATPMGKNENLKKILNRILEINQPDVDDIIRRYRASSAEMIPHISSVLGAHERKRPKYKKVRFVEKMRRKNISLAAHSKIGR